MGKVLSKDDLERFSENGFVRLQEAFPTRVATEARALLEQMLDVSFSDHRGWTQPRITIADVMTTSPFVDSITPRVRGAFDDLLGANQWKPFSHMGWWQITFPGFDHIDYGDDWHVDGRDFVHHPWSQNLRLFPLFLFSDIEAEGGGTLLDVGSHRRVAEVLWNAEPAGLSDTELSAVVDQLAATRSHVIEATGRAGDVYLCHPMIFHSSYRNGGEHPRVQATPHVVAAAGAIIPRSECVVDRCVEPRSYDLSRGAGTRA